MEDTQKQSIPSRREGVSADTQALADALVERCCDDLFAGVFAGVYVVMEDVSGATELVQFSDDDIVVCLEESDTCIQNPTQTIGHAFKPARWVRAYCGLIDEESAQTPVLFVEFGERAWRSYSAAYPLVYNEHSELVAIEDPFASGEVEPLI